MVQQRHHLDGHEFEQSLREIVGNRAAWRLQSVGSRRVRHDLAAKQQQ